MCNEAVDVCLLALQFVSDWFVINKMTKKLDDALFDNDDIELINKNSNNVTPFGNEIVIITVDLDKKNPDDDNFDEDHPEITIHVRLFA